ncbi:competence protein CoiA family protein [Noviherbaspirillum sp.]|uniref:competence protein CoiA family protein n=1 Tax=Noviherbaspirillum sp. TaxID=1926288 RepID=UPI002B474B15|nr:competence protein CoiA family protein [Noviherbaspirillum sp.]HJV81341.1 competence protein CoiA family protein [Noviherbaspirillum sp.]
MDKAREIRKFQALLQLAVSSGDELGEEMRFQQEQLRSLGLTDGDINNIIHDRHAREGISPAKAAIALASVRHAAGLPYYGIRRPPGQEKTREDLAAEYLRARGKDLRTASPASPITTSPIPAKAASNDLLVPYGVDPDANIVHARDAIPNIAYTCPSCETELVLHAGPIKARHFAHKANTACDGETLAHITAKLLIAKVIREHPSTGPSIHLRCACDECHTSFEKLLPSDAFSASKVEEPVGKYICDVVAIKAGAAVLAIEILKSHSVEDDKASALGLPWIELKADDVLEDPFHWRPAQARLKRTTCPKCKAKRAKLEEVAMHWKLPATHPDYIAAVAPCWSCHKDIIWYWWRGVPFAESRPPAPIPTSVQHRYSKMYGGRYWMNVCPSCNAPQGDNFVFLTPDSPFKGLPLNDTDSMREHRERNNASVVAQFMSVVRRNI